MKLSPTLTKHQLETWYARVRGSLELVTTSVDFGPETDKVWRRLVGAALFSAAVVLFFRNVPVGAIPAGDELAYSQMSRQLPYIHDWIPNYIFYLVYGSTNYCGAQFYSCAKLLNVLFFSVTGFVVFKTARLFVGQAVSFVIMLFFLASPFNVYTSLFMPETMYAAVAWALLYFFVSRKSGWNMRYVIAAGSAVGLLTMIKPHGIFFGGIYLSALIFNCAIVDREKASLVARRAAIFIVSFLAVRLTLGFDFADVHGFNILGLMYTNELVRHTLANYFHLLSMAATSGLKHILAMSLIAGVPICIMLVRSFRTAPDSARADKLNAFAAIFFVIMIGVTAGFTADIANIAPSETMARLHTRYYNFFDCVFCLVVLAELTRHDLPKLSSRIVAGACMAATAIFAIVYLPAHFQQSMIDNPDIHGLFWSENWFHIFGIIDVALIVLWIYKSRVAAILFLVMQVPLGLGLTTTLLTRDIRSVIQFQYDNPYAKAGILARAIWGKPVPKYFVAGTGVADGYHTAFQLDKRGSLIELGAGQTLHQAALPQGILNGIIVGSHPTDFPYVVTYADGPIKIIKIKHR